MISYHDTLQAIAESPLCDWLPQLTEQIQVGLSVERWGDLPLWHQAFEAIPDIQARSLDFNASRVKIGDADEVDNTTRINLERVLRELHPWRKGPFSIFGIEIDTEWRSDWKWDRLKDHISPLKDRLVLDVGCGSGYHCWRMLGAGAGRVVGIEPMPKYVYQFYALKKLAGDLPIDVFPVTLEQHPENLPVYDTVFSMGVLYHRRSPFDHLYQLKNCLRNGGELVLETLVAEGAEGYALVPPGRYAKMRNVWFIPSVDTLIQWTERCGFKNVRCVDVNQTSTQEQRATDWMTFESLSDFLNAENSNQTIEGLPAPTRAILIAEK